MAPTAVKFSLNPSDQIVRYNYTIDYSPIKDVDVFEEFIKNCEKRQIETDYYYSVVSDNYLRVETGSVSYTIFVFFINLPSCDINIKVQNYTILLGHLNITRNL